MNDFALGNSVLVAAAVWSLGSDATVACILVSSRRRAIMSSVERFISSLVCLSSPMTNCTTASMFGSILALSCRRWKIVRSVSLAADEEEDEEELEGEVRGAFMRPCALGAGRGLSASGASLLRLRPGSDFGGSGASAGPYGEPAAPKKLVLTRTTGHGQPTT